MKNNSNGLVKTISFVIIVAIISLLYFGIGGTDRTSIEIVSFSFVILALFLLYLSTLLSNTIRKHKKDSGDVTSIAALYLIANVILNFILKIAILKDLVIWNIILILIFLLLFMVVVFAKKKN